MDQKRMLENQIEYYRKKLNYSVSMYGFNDNRTIQLSHELDVLLNDYNKKYQV